MSVGQSELEGEKWDKLMDDALVNMSNVTVPAPDLPALDPCDPLPLPFITAQFFLVAIFGGCLSLVSIAFNSLLLNLFLTRPYFRTSNFFYLTVLCVFDIIHSFLYIIVMVVITVYEYFHYLPLMRIWLLASSSLALSLSTT